MNGKGRPEKLTDELKVFITQLQQGRKKKLKGPEVLKEVKLHLENQGVDISENLPGLSSIQKFLKEKKDRDKPSELDKLWNIGLLAQDNFTARYPELNAEAVEAITEVQKWAEKNHIEKVFDKGYNPVRFGLTLRQALWIARLHRAVKKYVGNNNREIWRTSWTYSAYEILCKLSGIDFDTWEFDRALRKASKTKGINDFEILIWNIFRVGNSDEDNAFIARFQMEIASQSIKPRILRSIKEISEEAKQHIAESEKIKDGE